ncbi:MAG: hypothetical protein P4L56_11325 [Candidatus Sulfopaludibacter sp.]|nr:hypothetical protein [Candidatus Sulfopaludibacter sp.]
MANKIGSLAAGKVIQRMTAPAGVSATLAALMFGGEQQPAAFSAAQIRPQNVAADLAERGDPVVYPAANVYCEKIINSLVEKFRTFSGTLQMAIELRASQDRLAGLQDGLELYADAVMQMLDAHRGDWGDGMYYCGGYQVVFSAVKHGGKNYIQTAKVTFEIGVSIS